MLPMLPVCCKYSQYAASNPSMLPILPACCQCSQYAASTPSMLPVLPVCCQYSEYAASTPSMLQVLPVYCQCFQYAASTPSILPVLPICCLYYQSLTSPLPQGTPSGYTLRVHSSTLERTLRFRILSSPPGYFSVRAQECMKLGHSVYFSSSPGCSPNITRK